MKDLKKAIENDRLYTSLEETDAIKRLYENDIRQKEYKKGINKGRKEERKETINKLLSYGMPKEEVYNILDIHVD